MRKLFLSVHTGVDGHIEMGIIRKPDLQDLRFLLGRHNIRLSGIRDGRPVAQLPFLALGILQPIGSLEGSTYFGILPEYDTDHEFLERRLWRDSEEPSRLNGGLKICREQKFLGSRKKNSRLCQFHMYN